MVDRLSDLERLTRLRDSGALTESEFAAQKASLLAPKPRLAGRVIGIASIVAVVVLLGVFFVLKPQSRPAQRPVAIDTTNNAQGSQVASNVAAPPATPATAQTDHQAQAEPAYCQTAAGVATRPSRPLFVGAYSLTENELCSFVSDATVESTPTTISVFTEMGGPAGTTYNYTIATRQGRATIVELVITGGSHADQALRGRALESYIREVANAAGITLTPAPAPVHEPIVYIPGQHPHPLHDFCTGTDAGPGQREVTDTTITCRWPTITGPVGHRAFAVVYTGTMQDGDFHISSVLMDLMPSPLSAYRPLTAQQIAISLGDTPPVAAPPIAEHDPTVYITGLHPHALNEFCSGGHREVRPNARQVSIICRWPARRTIRPITQAYLGTVQDGDYYVYDVVMGVTGTPLSTFRHLTTEQVAFAFNEGPPAALPATPVPRVPMSRAEESPAN